MTDNDQHKPTLADALVALLEAPLTEMRASAARVAAIRIKIHAH